MNEGKMVMALLRARMATLRLRIDKWEDQPSAKVNQDRAKGALAELTDLRDDVEEILT